MKKIYFLAAIALVAGVSCTKQVPVTNNGPETPIAFSPISQRVGTKANVFGEQNATYTAQNSGAYEAFAAWSYYTASNATNPQANSAPAAGSEFFANVTCEHVAGTNNDYWAPSSETYYWPKAGFLSFHALSPADFTKTSTAHSWANGFTITGYQAPAYTDANAEGVTADGCQIDLLYSDFVFNKKRSDFTATGNTVELYDDETDDGAYKHDGVDLTFRHALSTILFQAKTNIDYKGTRTQQHKFIVRKIEVLNAYNTGNFYENRTDDVDNKYEIPGDMTGKIGMHKGNEAGIDTDDDSTPDQGTPYWSTFSNEVTLTPYDVTAAAAGTGSEATSTSGNTQIGQTLIALPQNLAAGNAVQVRVTFEYSFSSDGGTIWSSPFTQTLTLDLGGKTGNYGVDNSYVVNDWLINHKYTYTLVFKLDPIIFDPAVEAFVEVDDITVELPQI